MIEITYVRTEADGEDHQPSKYEYDLATAGFKLLYYEIGYGGSIVKRKKESFVVTTAIDGGQDTTTFSGEQEDIKKLLKMASSYPKKVRRALKKAPRLCKESEESVALESWPAVVESMLELLGIDKGDMGYLAREVDEDHLVPILAKHIDTQEDFSTLMKEFQKWPN